MKFDYVIGNPPYQQIVKKATKGNNANTVDVYQYFQKSALQISDSNCLIYPAKDLQRGKTNLMDKKLVRVRIYNGSNKETEKNIPGEPSVFGDAVRRIPGDVGVFYWNSKNQSDNVMYQDTIIKRTDKIMPIRKEFFALALALRDYAGKGKNYSIRKCCESYFVEQNPESVLGEVEDRTKDTPSGYTKVITNNKAGSGGKAKWFYIKTIDLDFVQPSVYKVVISSAYPNEAFKNPDNLEILSKNEMFGRTKMCLYYTNELQDAENYIKFLHTDFVKNVVEMTPFKFLYYLPEFTDINSYIDWTKSIAEIDEQLLVWFGLKDKR